MTISPSSSFPLSPSPTTGPKRRGGPRTPGPGKRIGRPRKAAKDKAVVLQIVLSNAKKRTALKRKAKAAKLTPGALIERELKL
jgi:hypothetical protein